LSVVDLFTTDKYNITDYLPLKNCRLGSAAT